MQHEYARRLLGSGHEVAAQTDAVGRDESNGRLRVLSTRKRWQADHSEDRQNWKMSTKLAKELLHGLWHVN
jgi:hypothetical protein